MICEMQLRTGQTKLQEIAAEAEAAAAMVMPTPQGRVARRRSFMPLLSVSGGASPAAAPVAPALPPPPAPSSLVPALDRVEAELGAMLAGEVLPDL